MGIRPNIKTIFGLDDFKSQNDPRLLAPWPKDWYEELFEAEMKNMPVFIALNPDKPNFFYEVIHWNPSEQSNVIGLVTSQLYDHDCIRALAMIDPRFTKADYQALPLDKSGRPMLNRAGNEMDISPVHFYQQGFYLDVPQWIEAAIYIFNHLKIGIKPVELKWMLYWQWS